MPLPASVECPDFALVDGRRFELRASDATSPQAAADPSDWATFARRYNGPGYAKNDYDGKLQRAYDRFAQQAAPTPAATRSAREALEKPKLKPKP